MTIAACYLSPEGVIFGADSATTFGLHNHFFHGQKIYEIGREGESTLGLTMWGLGSMGALSYRTLIARMSDHAADVPTLPVEEAAKYWADIFWEAYSTEFKIELDRFTTLKSRTDRSPEDEEAFESILFGHSGGFCLGGYSLPDRQPKAYSIKYSPDLDSRKGIEEVSIGTPEFWGQPNMLQRLSYGIDLETYLGILHAKLPDGNPAWTGTQEDLLKIIVANKLGTPSRHLPVREAIDWVYSSVYTTIKAMKYANMPPVCGGPIEVAVITSDRYFRWVRHKELDAAVGRHLTKDH